ncbi:MAG: sugar ABC transporter substrate-binding protein [Firmicutes bacterium]|nr:sugar ABC transporter substrate-binding protein [Bacillota bacterium]
MRTFRTWVGSLAFAATLALSTLSSMATAPIQAASRPPWPGGKAPTIALVRQLCVGDFFTQWLAGAQAEAKALGVKLNTYCANGNNAQMVADMQTAISLHVKAIIADHGLAQTMDPVIEQALNHGIHVVTFDLSSPDPRVVTIDQNDLMLGLEISDAMMNTMNGHANVGYVYVAGFLPLDKRNSEWKAIQQFFPGMKQVATWGTVSTSTIADVQNETVAALQAHPNINAILAPYDAFAQGAVNGILQLHRKNVKVFGADISTADIQTMVKPGSPWVATCATDPADVGRTAVRAAALRILGQYVPTYVEIDPTLITQQFLRAHHVTTMAQLLRVLPSFGNTGQLQTSWMKALGG